ncbi:MAG: hypothetical protein AAF467_10400 [Actinomycetota bacterium]
MKQITIENLHCTDDLESFGDELRLEIYTDGELETAYRNRMHDGDDWAVKAGALFDDVCTIKLIEEDKGFPAGDDDLIGTVIIGGAEVSGATADIKRGDADYTITYSVRDRTDVDADSRADIAAAEFERSEQAGVWAAIDKATLLGNVRDRQNRAIEIDQERSNFCGPTSVVYELARTQPRRYVEMCRQLYETGGFWSRSERVEAPQSLRSDAVGQKMDPADWMLIATMRNAENALFKVKAASRGIRSGLEGMTHPWEIKGWAEEILGKDDVDVKTCFVFGELDAIKRAQEAFDAGGSAFILLNMAVLKSGERDIPPWPDHWVVFHGNLDITDDRVTYDVYTWGKIMTLDLDRERFEDHIFTVVTAV